MASQWECVVLCGPAGCGQTREAVREYVQQVKAHGEDSALLLLPTLLACQRTRRSLMEEGSFSALFDPRILTFPELAELVLRANRKSVARISAAQRHLLMRQVLRELCQAGALPTLAPMCAFPGFVDELCSLVDELKRAAVDPQQFERAVAEVDADDARSRELAVVYAQYQKVLQERGVFDDAGQFWQARDVLRSGARRPFEKLRLIVVDGFADFTTTQLQVLRELAAGAEGGQVLITLCLESDPGRRPELFHVTHSTLENLRQPFPELRERWLPAPQPEGEAGALTALGHNLFALEEPPPVTEQPPVEFIAAPGRRAEVHQVAVRIKQLIRDESARPEPLGVIGKPSSTQRDGRSVRPERIGVIARDLSAYRQALTEVFREAGVPLNIHERAPVATRPSVQAVLDILRVPARGLRCADVMRLLKSNYVDLKRLQPDEPIKPDEVERIARAAGIIRGDRTYWLERLEAYRAKVLDQLQQSMRRDLDEEEEWLSLTGEKLQREPRAIERAQALLTALFDELAKLPEQATPARFVEVLWDLAESLGVQARVGLATDATVAGANIRALRAFLEGLKELWATDRQLGVADEVKLAEFSADAIWLAQILPCQQTCRAEPGVLALQAEDARGLDFDHVFLLGMTESEFPRAERESPLYDDSKREQLSRAGVPLEPRLSERYREAFLFYQLVSAARQRLWLSYPTVDPDGQELLRSHYVDEVNRCLGEQVLCHEYKLHQTVPEFNALTGPADLLQRCIYELYGYDVTAERQEEPALTGLRLLARSEPELLQALAAAIEVEDRRDSAQAPDEYDGRLSAPHTLERLAQDFGPEYCFSPSQLNRFGNCPFSFFAERVLGLEPLEDATEDVDPTVDGNLRHRCLSRFFREWGLGRALSAEDLPAAREMMTKIVAELGRQFESRHLVGDLALFRTRQAEIERDLHLWLEFEVAEVQSKGHTATDLEVSFGFERVPPLKIGDGPEQVLLRGRIDRVDRYTKDGTAALAVYDYKRSAGPSNRAIEAGRDLQLPAYALAAETLLAQAPAAKCHAWGYYIVRRPIKLTGASAKPEVIRQLIEHMAEWALRHAAAIRAGQFAPRPHDCRNCDFRSLCRWERTRFELKTAAGGEGGE